MQKDIAFGHLELNDEVMQRREDKMTTGMTNLDALQRRRSASPTYAPRYHS